MSTTAPLCFNNLHFVCARSSVQVNPNEALISAIPIAEGQGKFYSLKLHIDGLKWWGP